MGVVASSAERRRGRASKIAEWIAHVSAEHASPPLERLWDDLWDRGFSVVAVAEADGRRCVVVRREPGRPPLTPREKQVVVLASRGLALKAMAAELGTTLQTVHRQLHAALTKLGVRDRLELVEILGAASRGAWPR